MQIPGDRERLDLRSMRKGSDVLPNACETTLELSCNGRELIHIMNERLCSRAQWEIRELCMLMRNCVASYDDQCAEFAKFLKPKCATLGYCPEHGQCDIFPKKKLVLGDHKSMNTIRELMEDVKLGIYEDPEYIVDEVFAVCFPAEKD